MTKVKPKMKDGDKFIVYYAVKFGVLYVLHVLRTPFGDAVCCGGCDRILIKVDL